jgi:hypothetical protein
VASFDLLTPVDTLSDAERLVVVGAPEVLGLAIVRINGRIPVSRETWTQMADQGMRLSALGGQMGLSPATVVFARDFDDQDVSPFSFSTMKSRFNWIELRKTSDEEESSAGDSLGGTDKESEG